MPARVPMSGAASSQLPCIPIASLSMSAAAPDPHCWASSTMAQNTVFTRALMVSSRTAGRTAMTSVDRDADRIHHRAPLLDLGFEHPGGLARGIEHGLEPEIAEPRRRRGLAYAALDGVVQRRNDGSGGVGWHEEADPGVGVK